jgi:hypothetical protein
MDPLTITLMAVAATVGIAGAITGGVAAGEQAEFNEDMARRNAAQQKANAQQQRNLAKIQVEAQNAETNAEVDAVRRKNQAILAQNRAEAGMLGIDTTGSSLLLAVDNAENAEFEALEVQRTGRNKARQIQYESDVQAYNYEVAAQNSLMEANFHKSSQKYIALNTVFDAIGSGIQGAAAGANLSKGIKDANAARQKKD